MSLAAGEFAADHCLVQQPRGLGRQSLAMRDTAAKPPRQRVEVEQLSDIIDLIQAYAQEPGGKQRQPFKRQLAGTSCAA